MNSISKKLYLKELKSIFAEANLKKQLFVSSENYKNVLTFEDQGVAILSFNNPKKMNAINLELTRELYSWYETYQLLPEKLPIFIGDKQCKMFCSGADLKFIYDQRNNPEEYHKFFNLNYYLYDKSYEYAKVNKNIISIWNGVTMGGGLAHGIHSKFRVATESTVLAMPEAQFGYYTNCNYADFIKSFLNKEEALYMSLFSHRYKGYEVYRKKIATHFVLNKHLRNLIGDIKSICNAYDREKEIKKCIGHYQEISLKEHTCNEKEDVSHDELIKNLFDFKIERKNFHSFYENFKNKLKYINSDLYNDFISKSLLTNKLNFDISLSSFDDSLTYEDRFNLDVDCNNISMEVGNMFEGIRAYFVDKDKKPNWKINTFEELNKLNLL